MKIFVTGATGFIGSNFINRANFEGHQVIALRRSKGSKPRILLNFEPIWLTKELDQVNANDLQGVDCIVHLAAHSMSPPYDTLENCMYWNVIAPIRLFEEAIKAGIDKFVVAGSCFEYGLSGEKYDFIPVDAPLQPTLTYAASKASASISFSQLAYEKKLDLSYVRIFHVYGEGEDENRLFPSLKKAAFSNKDFPMTFGDQVRDFIHVSEVVERFLEMCSQPKTKMFKLFNLGSGKPQTIAGFSKFWWKKWNAKGKLLFGEIPYRKSEVFRYVPLI